MTNSFRRVTKKRPCQICGHSEWCTYTDTIAFCMRSSIGSFRTARNGAYMHRTGVQQREASVDRSPSRGDQPRASGEQLDRVYRAFLGKLSLSSAHKESLRQRGLDEAAITHGCYRSAPTEVQARAIVAELAPLGLRGIPGFYKVGDRWVLVRTPPGILIPVLNAKGQICGIQLRKDNHTGGGGKYIWFSSAKYHSGTSSGSPIHWSKPELLASATEVLLTEGGLKGDLISHFLSVPVIAAAGAGLFPREFSAQLKAKYPNISAVIAFDSDWREKPSVLAALTSLRRQLTKAGVNWRVRVWPTEYKGYDDYLLAMRSKEAA